MKTTNKINSKKMLAQASDQPDSSEVYRTDRLRRRSSLIAAVVATLAICLLLNGSQTEASSIHCSRVSGHIAGQVIGPSDFCNGALTETGTFTDKAGNLLGNFVACATGMETEGNGAIRLQLAHTYTLIGGDTFTTSDSIVLSPVDPPAYLVDNHATVTGGTGSYQDASGFIDDHGTFNFATRILDVNYRGQICSE